MKLEHQEFPARVAQTPVEDYVTKSLDFDRAGGTAGATAEAFGRLVEVLARKGLLTAAEVVYIAQDGVDPIARFVSDSQDLVTG